tara:strand:+ start:19 stop:705 length:687 start_codon:yes stop_codon:yes gene_type:complete
MIIRIKKEVFKKHPELRVAFIVLSNIDNKSKFKESKHLIKENEKLIKLTFNRDTIKNHDLIQPWSVVQQEFGKRAQHYHTSVEKLIQAVLKRKTVATGDSLTNLVRSLSLRYIFPFGIDDLANVEGNIIFDLAKGNERKNVLNKLKPGDLYYKDNKNILGAKLDYWKSNKTKVNSATKLALVHIEALPPINNKDLTHYLQQIKGLVKVFCGGKAKSFVLSKRKNSFKI